MANYKNLFMRYMDSEGVRYEEINEHCVRVTYNGDNLKHIPVLVFFDEDGDPLVQFKCWEIGNFKGKEAAGLMACNEVNKTYRWVKYCIDDDSDVAASIDAYIDPESCGKECLSLVRRVVNITDDAYPTFAKYLWGNP